MKRKKVVPVSTVPPEAIAGGQLLQRVRPWRMQLEGVTDGNQVSVSRIVVDGLTGLEFRTVIRLIADMPLVPAPQPQPQPQPQGEGNDGS
jgi:hypothetical protein